MSIRTLILLATLSALAGAPAAAHADDPAVISFTESFGGSNFAPPVVAVGLRAATGREPAGAVDVVLLVDTSASQVGEHRARSTEAIQGLLEKARPSDRFRIAVVDVGCTPLDDGFAPATGAEARVALQKLAERTPLGSTDIVAVLDSRCRRLLRRAGKAAHETDRGVEHRPRRPGELAVPRRRCQRHGRHAARARRGRVGP